MAHQPVCLVCKKDMEPGVMTDLGHMNTIHVPRWWPNSWSGEAERARFKEGRKISAYRCPECHALRLYAFEES